MPKKRAAEISGKDEQTKEVVSGSIIQDDDDAKRAKLAPPMKDTTLQDLPIAMLERILVKAVAMEVLELKVARCARKEQADLVIRRLGTVSSQWNSVLTTDIFKTEVHRLLEGQETIRCEILDQPAIQVKVLKLTTLRDEIFLLSSPLDGGTMVVNVYDRNNMTQVKDVIPIQGISPGDMAACSVSNCVYILNTERNSPSICRLTKDEEHHWKLSPWLNTLNLPVTSRGPILVSADGNLIILTSEQGMVIRVIGPGKFSTKPSCIGIYTSNGFMQHRIMLSPDIYGFMKIYNVIQKSDGNLVLLATNNGEAKFLEIDTTGRILRQHQSTLHGYNGMSFADVYGRILVTSYRYMIQLFDPEFNQLEIANPPPAVDLIWRAYQKSQAHFNSERNEIVCFEMPRYMNDGVDCSIESSVLSIFRFTNE